MVALRTIVLCAATFGAAAAKRVCTVRPSMPTATPTPTGSEIPEPTGTVAPPSEDFPIGGGGEGEPAPPLSTGEYKQSSHFEGQSWFTEWNHWSYPDPTHGRVNYVNVDTAQAKNLSYVGSDGKKFFMRVDGTSVLDPNGPGRDAVRIHSNNPIEMGISVLELTRMPTGASFWPAYWSCGPDWPSGGEFDIIEAVNQDTNNLMSLHTGDGCTQPDKGGSRDMTGSVGYWDCNANGAEGNRGCGVSSPDDHSVGKGFNDNGGGWYATERTPTSIKVWFWSRTDSKVPQDVKDNLGFVNPSMWGTPTAAFVSDSCDLNAKFGPQTGIINTTLCGDWAGNVFEGGIGACNDFVNNNPQAFQNEFWEIDRMTVYTQ